MAIRQLEPRDEECPGSTRIATARAALRSHIDSTTDHHVLVYWFLWALGNSSRWKKRIDEGRDRN